MATVYRASLSGVGGFEKEVAIKMIRVELEEDPQFTQMFLDEARLSARLNHANIVQTFDFGREEGVHFLAMELVEGRTLAALLRIARTKGRRLGVGPCLRVASEVAKALDYAHRLVDIDGESLGIVHRDVSPQNVLISREGEVKLADFGIAKAVLRSHVTQPGKVRGKCAYMAPEQIRGQELDGRADIFALGVLLWESLTGRTLFEGSSDGAVLHQVLEKEILPPSWFASEVPPEVDSLVARLLSRDVAERPDSRQAARELADLIWRLVRSEAEIDLAEVQRSLSSGTAVLEPSRALFARSAREPGEGSGAASTTKPEAGAHRPEAHPQGEERGEADTDRRRSVGYSGGLETTPEGRPMKRLPQSETLREHSVSVSDWDEGLSGAQLPDRVGEGAWERRAHSESSLQSEPTPPLAGRTAHSRRSRWLLPSLLLVVLGGILGLGVGLGAAGPWRSGASAVRADEVHKNADETREVSARSDAVGAAASRGSALPWEREGSEQPEGVGAAAVEEAGILEEGTGADGAPIAAGAPNSEEPGSAAAAQPGEEVEVPIHVVEEGASRSEDTKRPPAASGSRTGGASYQVDGRGQDSVGGGAALPRQDVTEAAVRLAHPPAAPKPSSDVAQGRPRGQQVGGSAVDRGLVTAKRPNSAPSATERERAPVEPGRLALSSRLDGETFVQVDGKEIHTIRRSLPAMVFAGPGERRITFTHPESGFACTVVPTLESGKQVALNADPSGVGLLQGSARTPIPCVGGN